MTFYFTIYKRYEFTKNLQLFLPKTYKNICHLQQLKTKKMFIIRDNYNKKRR